MDVNHNRPFRYGLAIRPILLYSGFTLLELLVTLAVASILLGIAAPAFTDLLRDTRMTTHINLLATSLNLARSEAVRRGSPVAVCKSSDGAGCGGQWRDGWLVYADTDRDRERGPDEPLIQVREGYRGGFTVDFASFYSHGNYVYYRPTGFVRTNGTFTFCDRRGAEEAKALILSKTGRLRVAEETGSGRALECE